MRFLVDAQLPYSLAELLRAKGHEVIHTLEFPEGNRTPDTVINKLALVDKRVVVTKDKDFLDSHLLTVTPPQLLFIVTGNISNPALLGLFAQNLFEIEQLLEQQGAVILDLFGVRKK